MGQRLASVSCAAEFARRCPDQAAVLSARDTSEDDRLDALAVAAYQIDTEDGGENVTMAHIVGRLFYEQIRKGMETRQSGDDVAAFIAKVVNHIIGQFSSPNMAKALRRAAEYDETGEVESLLKEIFRSLRDEGNRKLDRALAAYKAELQQSAQDGVPRDTRLMEWSDQLVRCSFAGYALAMMGDEEGAKELDDKSLRARASLDAFQTSKS